MIYTVNAFLLWGGGFFAHHGAVDFSGGYVIHLSAGVSGFVAAAVIGPGSSATARSTPRTTWRWSRSARGCCGSAGTASTAETRTRRTCPPSAAVLNTNLCTAVAFLVWVGWDYLTGRKPSLIGGVNGMITGLVAITPAAGYVNGWGAIALGVIASTIVYFALNYLSRLRPFRNVDDTLGVVYTHGFAGLAGGLLVGHLRRPEHGGRLHAPASTAPDRAAASAGVLHGNWTLLKWQFFAALFVIVFSAVGTFILLKLVGLFIPLRMSEENMEIGDTAEHGHEVYPSDVPSLGYPRWHPGARHPGHATPATA